MELKRLGIGLTLVIGLYCLYTLAFINGERSRTPSPFVPSNSSQGTGSASITIQVSGAVVRPGVYRLPANSRIQDALTQAGGLTDAADPNSLNLAGWLQDGVKVEVPTRTAIRQSAAASSHNETNPVPVMPSAIAPPVRVPSPPMTVASRGRDNITNIDRFNSPEAFPPREVATDQSQPGNTISASNSITVAPAGAGNELLQRNPININTASATELELLPEIGPKMAQRIVEYREINGPFRSPEALNEVKGIGQKTMDAVRPFITTS